MTLVYCVFAQRSENVSSKNMPAARNLLAKGRKTKAEKASKFVINNQTGNESIVTNAKKPLHTSTPADGLHHAEDSKSNIGPKIDR